MDVEEIKKRFIEGDRRALARLISLVENRDVGAASAMQSGPFVSTGEQLPTAQLASRQGSSPAKSVLLPPLADLAVLDVRLLLHAVEVLVQPGRCESVVRLAPLQRRHRSHWESAHKSWAAAPECEELPAANGGRWERRA